MYKIGIDVGGTFTDFVVAGEAGQPRFFKTQTTPDDPSIGVMTGLQDVAAAYGLPLEKLLGDTDLVIHGSTVATNTLVERKGARVGLITTDGFRDLLEMREGLKEDRYNLRMQPVEPLAARYLRVGLPERIRANGHVERPWTRLRWSRGSNTLPRRRPKRWPFASCSRTSTRLTSNRPGKSSGAAFPDMYTSLSHEVIPQIKEFDRLSTR